MNYNEAITLNLINAKHSKTYQVQLIQNSTDGWLVNFQYGAVGQTLQHGTKTKQAIPYEQAKKVYDKLVAEKSGKRCDCCGGSYTAEDSPRTPPIPIAHGAVSTSANGVTDQIPDWMPELLQAIEIEDAEKYIMSDEWEMEEKHDGNRVSIYQKAGKTFVYNKLGKLIPIPLGISEAIMEVSRGHSIHLDGEFIKDVYVVFDILELSGVDLAGTPRKDRVQLMEGLAYIPKVIEMSRTYRGTTVKRETLANFQAIGAEGVVFKRLSDPYMPGRQGVNRKLKFWKSCTVRVAAKTKEDGHHSFAVEVKQFVTGKHQYLPSRTSGAVCRSCGGDNGAPIHEGQWVPVGSVSVRKQSWQIPETGTFREVKYLYVGVGGRLYQPQDLGPRTDVTESDCSYEQLQHKAR